MLSTHENMIDRLCSEKQTIQNKNKSSEPLHSSALPIKLERVQWNQEQMLSEFKDLQLKRIFSPAEVREILKKRTTFETALIRRVPRKRDFLAYIEYEMNLERLRKMRVKKHCGSASFMPPCRILNEIPLQQSEQSFNFGSFNGSTTVSDLRTSNAKVPRRCANIGPVH